MEKGNFSLIVARWVAFLPAGAACGAFGFWIFKIAGDALEGFDGDYAGGIRLLGVVAMGLISVMVARFVAPSRSYWIPIAVILSYALVVAMWILIPKNDFPVSKWLLVWFSVVPMVIGSMLGILADWLFKPTRENNQVTDNPRR